MCIKAVCLATEHEATFHKLLCILNALGEFVIQEGCIEGFVNSQVSGVMFHERLTLSFESSL